MLIYPADSKVHFFMKNYLISCEMRNSHGLGEIIEKFTDWDQI